MSTFAVEAGGRWHAIDLQRRLLAFSPWMVEMDHGAWLVHGSLGAGSIDDVRSLVADWARQCGIDPPPDLVETVVRTRLIEQ